MGEVLSQNEIDSLLKALSSGELDVDEIKDDNEKQVKNCECTIESGVAWNCKFCSAE